MSAVRSVGNPRKYLVEQVTIREIPEEVEYFYESRFEEVFYLDPLWDEDLDVTPRQKWLSNSDLDCDWDYDPDMDWWFSPSV